LRTAVKVQHSGLYIYLPSPPQSHPPNNLSLVHISSSRRSLSNTYQYHASFLLSTEKRKSPPTRSDDESL
jgi:hypothetical protein